MAEIDLSHGIPHIHPTKVIPRPFSRTRIKVARSSTPQRSWGWIAPGRLVAGDVLPGKGVVLVVREEVAAPVYGSGLDAATVVARTSWLMRVWAGDPEPREYLLDPSHAVWAFAQWNQVG